MRSQYPDLENIELETLINDLAYQAASNLYDSNKYIRKCLADGLIFKRHNPSKKERHIHYIDIDETSLLKTNRFKIVNQLEIQGKELRILERVMYIKGIPMVVFEFKTLIEENVTIFNAFEQLTNRYKRVIPELMKYNAIYIISDGVNNKAGSLFAPYDFFYGWHKITGEEKKALTGIHTLTSIVHGMLN